MSLIAEFARTAAARPEKVALITEKSQLTYDDLLNLVQVFDMELTTRGVRPGQTLVFHDKRAEFTVAMALLASLHGLTLIFAPSATATALGVEVDRTVGTAPDPDVAPERQITIEPGWFATMGTLPRRDLTARGDGSAVFVFASSGSTGEPKLVRSAEADRLAAIHLGAGFPDLDLARRRFLTTLSTATGWGFSNMLSSLLAGGSVLALGPDRSKLLSYIDLYRVDTLGTTPLVAQLMLEAAGAAQYLASLRDVRFGGAMASPELLAAFAAICPARLHTGWGAAEIGTAFGAIHDPADPRPAGHIGRFVRDDLEIGFFGDDLSPRPDADEGIVGFRPKTGEFRRRYMAGGSDARTGFHGGWFFPGDVMRREGAEYFLIGRVKNIVNIGGNKFSLDAVRQVLERAFPNTTQVPVVEADAAGLERLAVAYGAAGEITATAMTEVLKDRFIGLTVTRTLRLPEIPLTPSGKIDMQEVKARLMDG